MGVRGSDKQDVVQRRSQSGDAGSDGGCSTTGTEAGPVPATKGGEPERDRSVVL